MTERQPDVDELPDDLKAQGSAAILLLGDFTPEQQVAIIRSACPGIIATVAEGNLKAELQSLIYRVEDCMGIADGSSGLGALAAKDLNMKLNDVFSTARSIIANTGIKGMKLK